MKSPIKPGSEASKLQEGGSLGNIDELMGNPGNGAGGSAHSTADSGTSAGVKPSGTNYTGSLPNNNRAPGEEKTLYDRLAEKDATPTE